MASKSMASSAFLLILAMVPMLGSAPAASQGFCPPSFNTNTLCTLNPLFIIRGSPEVICAYYYGSVTV
ncbi:hypothetical protein HU200_040850 [Digitaria exilis]|uniref:Uncharacterized protein n=1 Tax=Digitaria exilis TaxID=1010633 RepID=A0A835B7I7_9POAL|nr:hypothetical protein HU200_040850 [Digitaria exilis]